MMPSDQSSRTKCSQALNRCALICFRARTLQNSTAGKRCAELDPLDMARSCFPSEKVYTKLNLS